MFDRIVVHEALKSSGALDSNPEWTNINVVNGQDSVISLMIHDIFGGEILKTHKKKGWHFYNRINGERLDFTRPESGKHSYNTLFEDLPSTAAETCNYVEQEEYSTFLMRFIRAFEEAVGLEKYQPGLTA